MMHGIKKYKESSGNVDKIRLSYFTFSLRSSIKYKVLYFVSKVPLFSIPSAESLLTRSSNFVAQELHPI
jgi:hypothetical protein